MSLLLAEQGKRIVRRLFDYKNGFLVWRPRHAESFASYTAYRQWMGRNCNKIAGCLDVSGYWLITYKKRTHGAHRLVWVWHFGKIPKGKFIDHIDGNKSNNKIENLRLCDDKQNQWNAKTQSRNKTGVKGLSVWNKYYGKIYVAEITFRKKRYAKSFQFSDAGKLSAEKWLVQTREHLHAEFANHGSGCVITKGRQVY